MNFCRLSPFIIILLALCSSPSNAADPDLTIGQFDDAALDGWKAEGTAFHFIPAGKKEHEQGAQGDGLVGTTTKEGAAKGSLLSPEFTIERPYLNFLAAGARDVPSILGAELRVEGEVVRAAGATEAKDPDHTLRWRTWDVRALKGRRATIRVNDQSSFGSLVVDQFIQSDDAKGVPCDATHLGHESHRPQFHYTALTGWLNDANGLLQYKGAWHLFHQHRPVDGSGICWGHAVSRDLLHWERLPDAIASGNKDACASGSGLVDWENASDLKQGEDPPILLFHTLMPPPNPDTKATQCLVYSTDGLKTLRNFSGNPVLRTPATRDRDPKVFFHAPTHAWIMALSLSRNNTDREHATYGLFRSKDLKSWDLIQELGPGPWFWECPDMFELPLNGDLQKMKWIFMKGSGDYMVGEFDGNHFTPEAGPIRIHWGGNFYGAQTFSDDLLGQRIQMGWMSTGKNGPSSYPGMPFNQQMSVPIELTLRSTPDGPRIFRNPVRELEKLRVKTHDIGARKLAPEENALEAMKPGLMEIELEMTLGEAKKLSLKCRGEELSYDVKSRKLRCGTSNPTIELKDGKLALHVFLDRTSIEAFVNGGAWDVNAIYFPDMSDETLSLTVDGGAAQIQKLVVHELKGIWPAE
jgi:sucrose-6-phosphate hydrolase SacC (GH32 family)